MRWLVLLLLIACDPGNKWRPYSPASGHTERSRADVMQKATIAITDAGKDIESSDAATGIVLSKWIDKKNEITDGGYRFRVRITVDDAGAYEVAAQCASRMHADEEWKSDCDETKRPQWVLDLVGRIDAAVR